MNVLCSRRRRYLPTMQPMSRWVRSDRQSLENSSCTQLCWCATAMPGRNVTLEVPGHILLGVLASRGPSPHQSLSKHQCYSPIVVGNNVRLRVKSHGTLGTWMECLSSWAGQECTILLQILPAYLCYERTTSELVMNRTQAIA